MTYKLIENVKIAYSMTLVVFSIVVVIAFNAEGQTQVAEDIQPAVSLLLMWVLLIWLSASEGGQCSILNLKHIKPERFEESHPITSKICSLGYKGDNLNRYLLGRQFLVIILIFSINICGAPLADAQISNLPSWIHTSFIESGIAITSVIVILGQLPAQVNAWHCVLDYTNNSFMTFTLYVSLIIEASGIMHMVYLVQYSICWLSGKPLETNEAPRNQLHALFFWGRCILSMSIFAFSMAITLDAIWQGQTTTWNCLPNVVSLMLLFILLFVSGMLEGMKMAYFAIAQLPKSQRELNPVAMKTCDLLFHCNKHGLPGFWVGRQMLVTLCFVVLARMTKVNVDRGVEENILGVSDGLQTFFNWGYLGAIITTILGSLSWQLIASIYPLEFLSNPWSLLLVQLCVWLEASAICSAYQVFGTIYRKVAGFQYDEVYMGNNDDDLDKTDSTLEIVAELHLKIPTKVRNDKVTPATPQTPDDFESQTFASQKSSSEHQADISTANAMDIQELLQHCTTRNKQSILEQSLAFEKAALEDLKTEQRIIESEALNDMESGESQSQT